VPNYSQKAVNNFVKGLITEAGELSFPENASIDELNCNLFRDGSRRRRKAINFEENNVNSTFVVGRETRVHFGEWLNVGNNAAKNYLVVQVANQLFFYDKEVAPFSLGQLPNFVNLGPYAVGSSGGALNFNCDFTSVLGRLVVVSGGTEPVYIEEEDDGTFTVTPITCRIRDFEWLGDRAEYGEEEPVAAVTNERKYDTKNAGWVTTGSNSPVESYIDRYGAYPALTHPWFSGKGSDGLFREDDWKRIYSGTSVSGNGHYVLDLFNKNRSFVSGVPSLSNEVETSRFTTVTSFSSRVFFTGLRSSKNSGKIFFSQIIQEINDIGEFLQKNDPTSEEISDLLDTDGGVIVIPEASTIKKIYAFRNSVFVFADNGVWQIKGVDDVFKPTAYSVGRISEVGILTPGSFTAAEGVPFWWSRHGIHTLQFDEFGNASEQNLSIGTIQTFWDELGTNAKQTVQATYDKVNKKIFWLYKNRDEEISNKYNRVLVLDVTLQAFYPWKFEDNLDDLINRDYILGFQFYPGYGSTGNTFEILSNTDDVESNSVPVVSTQMVPLEDNNVSIVFFVRDVSASRMTMGILGGTDFLDWGVVNYESYAETGYEFGGDLVLKKTAPYLVFYLRETEQGFTGDDTNGYEVVNNSSLLVSTYWDFKKTPSSTPQEVYKRKLPFVVDPSNLSQYPSQESMVITRIKCRGRGRSMKFRMESQQGKDFIYLGHGVIIDTASRF